MNDQPLNDQPSSRVNQILDLLVEEIEERIQVRRRATPPVKPAVAPPPKAPPPPPPVGVERKNVLSEPQAEAKGHPLDPKPEPDLPCPRAPPTLPG